MPGSISILETNPNDIDRYLDGIFQQLYIKILWLETKLQIKCY